MRTKNKLSTELGVVFKRTKKAWALPVNPVLEVEPLPYDRGSIRGLLAGSSAGAGALPRRPSRLGHLPGCGVYRAAPRRVIAYASAPSTSHGR